AVVGAQIDGREGVRKTTAVPASLRRGVPGHCELVSWADGTSGKALGRVRRWSIGRRSCGRLAAPARAALDGLVGPDAGRDRRRAQGSRLALAIHQVPNGADAGQPSQLARRELDVEPSFDFENEPDMGHRIPLLDLGTQGLRAEAV